MSPAVEVAGVTKRLGGALAPGGEKLGCDVFSRW